MYKIEKVPEIFLKNLSNFLSGTGLTLELAFYTVIFGTLLGVIVTLLRRCKIAPVRWIMNLYVRIPARYSFAGSGAHGGIRRAADWA